MADVDTAEDAELRFRLIYRSRSRIPTEQRDSALGEIFSTAQANNGRSGVTGALLITDHYFVQTLEGDESTVRSLFDRIQKDARHDDVMLIDERAVDTRTFSNWAMARVSSDGHADIPLHTVDGVIGKAARDSRSLSREQATVLKMMRDTIGADTV